MPKWINGLHLAKIYRGFDVDHVGDHATRMLETQNPKLRRMRSGGDSDIKDWNEILRRPKTITNLTRGSTGCVSRESSSQISAKWEESCQTA